MTFRRSFSLLGSLIFVLSGCSAAKPRSPEAPHQAGFSFLHITDAHIGPYLERSTAPASVRGAETIDWICEQAGQPQRLASSGPIKRPAAPPPEFAVLTGDVTEYGVIDRTWETVEEAFGDLPCPMYVLPGNHDNTWVAMYDVLRRRHGGENYSFDRHGFHFICISSASPQEPVPTIDAKTRAWLAADLDGIEADTPVFVALHHPPDSSEFANPAELDTLIDMLRSYNVVMLLHGHGHVAAHRNIRGVLGVMGGSTYGENAGYGVVTVLGGTVRYDYHYHRGDPNAPEGAGNNPTWKKLFEKRIAKSAKPRLFDIQTPEPGAVIASTARSAGSPHRARNVGGRPGDLNRTHDVGAGDSLSVKLVEGGSTALAPSARVSFWIDGEKIEPMLANDARILEVPLALDHLTAGARLLSVAVKQKGSRDRRTRVFHIEGPDTEVLWRKTFPAAIKAGPVVAGNLLVVARNDGRIVAMDKQTGVERWTFATGGEILATPAWSRGTIVFGSGDGKVYALHDTGRLRWTYRAGVPVYGQPLIDGDTVFIGDNTGRMHALNLSDGKPRWTFDRADFGIESKPSLWNGMLVFGAWDGYLYAVDQDTGALRWKSLGPKSSDGKAARYYAPADCGPIVVADSLFVCDRGYELGAYRRDGTLETKWPLKTSGIAPDPGTSAFFARTTDNRICRLDETGTVLWEADVPAGRFPIPPTVKGDRVYVCSNRGLLSALDASDGSTIWQYQATPGFYVMAPVAVDSPSANDAAAVCYVAGMDGSLTAVRYRQNTRSTRHGQYRE